MQQTLTGAPAQNDIIIESVTKEHVRSSVQKSLTPRPVDTSLMREKALLDKGYLFGSTTVFCNGGRYFFVGDIQHCGLKAIAHNAARMRDEMIRHGWGGGHMNYNDPPEFEKVFDRKSFDKSNECYKYDIYAWDDNGPVLFDVFGIEPQSEEYFDTVADEKFYKDLHTRIREEEEYAKSIGEDKK